MCVRIVLVLLLFVAAGSADEWPFGKSRGFTKLDDYNLGLLGAKAADAATPKPDLNAPPRGGRRAVQMERPSGDDGPEALRVDVLYPGGPAEKAGLKEGDVIVGIGRRRFSHGSLQPLADALLKAEAGKGEITLLVKRDGKVEKIEAAIPVGGRDARKPTTGKGRQAIVDAALKWLAEHQEQDGGFAETLSGKNGAVVLTSLAGLAWLGAGSDLENGPYKDNVRRAAEWVAVNARALEKSELPQRPDGPSWNQANWGWSHAAIFLGELHARTPTRSVLDALQFCASKLVATQEQSGGWAHGPGGKNALGYLELNIVTGLALSGLGLAKQSGFEVPEETIKKAEAYLEASSGGGGVGYSTLPGQKGQGNIGRTAGCWLGFLALGRGKAKFARSMGSYVKREAGNVLGGHASLMQHILLAGVAAHVQGGAARKAYWKACERDLVLARAPDGSLQPRPWHESLGMQSNSDVTFGEVWTTAAWTIVLVSDRGRGGFAGFPAWAGEAK
jgi:hypothetical protein